ncbi:DinB family protein [Sutcliffiella cohnii]
MDKNQLLIMNFNEIRRRSIIVWRAIPNEYMDWKPDKKAMSCSQMIRHVLEAEFLYHKILLAGGTKNSPIFTNPFEGRKFVSVEDELKFVKPLREDFITYISDIPESDLENKQINREDVGYVRTLGDMLLRIGYHESVHTGQLLDYMRSMGITRPNIWD